MRNSFSRFLVLLIAIGAIACDNGSITVPTPAPTVTEDFSGSLTTNGAAAYPFAVTAAVGGTVTATLTTVSPSTQPIGFALGNWNAAVSTCTLVVANEAALQASTLSATTPTFASLCVRVFDASGTIPADTTVAYTVQVMHPQ